MVTRLLGVDHEEKYAKRTLDKLSALHKGQTLALEVVPADIAFFERIYSSGERNVNERMGEHAKERTKNVLNKLIKTFEEDPSVIFKTAILRTLLIEGTKDIMMFHYKLFEHAKKVGARCVPLESQLGFERAVFEYLAVEYRKGLRSVLRARLFVCPVREQAFKKKIMRAKPDYAVMGAGHVKAAQSLLAKAGYPSKIVFKQKGPLIKKPRVLLDAAARAYYKSHKKRQLKKRKQARRR